MGSTMKVGDRITFRRDDVDCTDDGYNKGNGCLFGKVVSFDESHICIEHMDELIFVKREYVEEFPSKKRSTSRGGAVK